MTGPLRTVAGALAHWLDECAAALMQIRAWLSPRRRYRLEESAEGRWTLRRIRRRVGKPVAEVFIEAGAFTARPPRALAALRGASLEIALDPARCMVRTVEVPKRAAAFVDGVVRAQIDRLTPWRPEEAAFGHAPARSIGDDTVAVDVAAAPLAALRDLISAASGSGADAFALLAPIERDGDAFARIYAQDGRIRRLRRTRWALAASLVAAVAVAAGGTIASMTLGAANEAKVAELRAGVAKQRAALAASKEEAADDELAKFAARKRAARPVVETIEALARALPDSAYLTELRIEDGKVAIAGVATDASSLIGPIEASRDLAQATFSAPTTRSPDETGERFHIDAQIANAEGVRP
jgi:general secretion pathway protein L